MTMQHDLIMLKLKRFLIICNNVGSVKKSNIEIGFFVLMNDLCNLSFYPLFFSCWVSFLIPGWILIKSVLLLVISIQQSHFVSLKKWAHDFTSLKMMQKCEEQTKFDES